MKKFFLKISFLVSLCFSSGASNIPCPPYWAPLSFHDNFFYLLIVQILFPSLVLSLLVHGIMFPVILLYPLSLYDLSKLSLFGASIHNHFKICSSQWNTFYTILGVFKAYICVLTVMMIFTFNFKCFLF